MMQPRDEIVSASEIAEWVWCPESWRLKAVGLKPSNEAKLLEGEKQHAQTAGLELVSQRAIMLGFLLLLAAAVVPVVLFFLPHVR